MVEQVWGRHKISDYLMGRVQSLLHAYCGALFGWSNNLAKVGMEEIKVKTNHLKMLQEEKGPHNTE